MVVEAVVCCFFWTFFSEIYVELNLIFPLHNDANHFIFPLMCESGYLTGGETTKMVTVIEVIASQGQDMGVKKGKV